MRNIILTFCLTLTVCIGYGQLKVVTNGSVGIGGINPSNNFKLDVNGNLKVQGSTISFGATPTAQNRVLLQMGQGRPSKGNAEILFYADTDVYPGGGASFLRNGNGGTTFTHRGTQSLNFFCQEAASILFLSDSKVRMAVTNSGDLGVGTSSPTSKLQVTGDVKATGYITISDKRLKDNVSSYDSGLDKLLLIQPYTYNYNGDAGLETNLKHFGVLAQDFEEVEPDAVGDYLYENKDLEGNVLESASYKYVQTEAIKYMLVNAVKEQQEIIEDQNDRITKLEELVKVLVDVQTESVDISQSSSSKALLGDNYPNPFDNSTRINYFLPEYASSAQINIFDMAGKLVREVDIDNTGNGVLEVNVSDITNGVYTYQMLVDGVVVDTKTMSVAK